MLIQAQSVALHRTRRKPGLGLDRMSKLSTLRLLAIDGDPRGLALITDALAQERAEISTASDPEAGFELFL